MYYTFSQSYEMIVQSFEIVGYIFFHSTLRFKGPQEKPQDFSIAHRIELGISLIMIVVKLNIIKLQNEEGPHTT